MVDGWLAGASLGYASASIGSTGVLCTRAGRARWPAGGSCFSLEKPFLPPAEVYSHTPYEGRRYCVYCRGGT